MENNIVQLFVYGSLRSGFKSNAYNYISQYFTLVGLAKAKGILINMGTYPVAIATIENKFVVGELYEIKDKNAFNFIMAQLDDYEGINVEADEVALYKRNVIDVYVDNVITSKAYVYWFCGDVSNKPIIESGDVLQYFEEKIN